MYKQHRRIQGGRPPSNRNASNDNFVTKTAILSSVSFSWFVFTLTRDSEDLFVFFARHLFFEKNSALQTVKPVLIVFLFWCSLYKLWIAPPPILNWSSTKFRPPPPSELLSWTVKTFFLEFTYVICGFGRLQSKILATPMINDESDISR